MQLWNTSPLAIIAVNCIGILGAAHAQPADQSEKSRVPSDQILSLTAEHDLASSARRNHPESIIWEGIELDSRVAESILMNVVENPESAKSRRLDALGKLSAIHSVLRGSDSLPRLIALYDKDVDIETRRAVVLCLCKSMDPRAFDLLFRITQSESGDSMLRVICAGGLAQWNVRQGVRQLAMLADSDESIHSHRTIGDEAMILLQSLDQLKNWGYDARPSVQSIITSKSLNHSDKRHALRDNFVEWFEANAYRFPDWRPGDPLPEVDKEGMENP